MNGWKKRIPGILYALVGVFGGFSLGYVAPLGASASSELIRWGQAADVIQVVAFVALVMVVRRRWEPVPGVTGDLMVGFVVLASALMLAGDAAVGARAFELRASLLSVAQVFFGLWLVPLAVLGRRSRDLPVWIAGLLVAGAAVYLVQVGLAFWGVETTRGALGLLSIVPAVAEIGTVIWFCAKGVTTVRARPESA